MECFIGGIQFFIHSPSPFPGQFNEDVVDSSDLSGFETLYFTRAYGLSDNSSICAEKIFILVLMLAAGDFKRFNAKIQILVASITFLGIIATFNRTVIFSLLIFGILLCISRFAKTWKSIFSVVAAVTVLVVLTVAVYPVDALNEVLSFGVSAGGIGSRYIIWEEAIEFINNHLLWGNHSAHIYFDYFGTSLHAHNSFIEMMAMHGILIAALLFLFVLFNISKTNFPIVASIMAYSLTQYGIFWAISLLDLVFYYYLLRPQGVLVSQESKCHPLAATYNAPIPSGY